MTTEEWLPVPIAGYELAYSVSNQHRVRSDQRCITHKGPWGVLTRPVRERILKPHKGGVTLSAGGVPTWARVEDLVRLAFGEAA